MGKMERGGKERRKVKAIDVGHEAYIKESGHDAMSYHADQK